MCILRGSRLIGLLRNKEPCALQTVRELGAPAAPLGYKSCCVSRSCVLFKHSKRLALYLHTPVASELPKTAVL